MDPVTGTPETLRFSEKFHRPTQGANGRSLLGGMLTGS